MTTSIIEDSCHRRKYKNNSEGQAMKLVLLNGLRRKIALCDMAKLKKLLETKQYQYDDDDQLKNFDKIRQNLTVFTVSDLHDILKLPERKRQENSNNIAEPNGNTAPNPNMSNSFILQNNMTFDQTAVLHSPVMTASHPNPSSLGSNFAVTNQLSMQSTPMATFNFPSMPYNRQFSVESSQLDNNKTVIAPVLGTVTSDTENNCNSEEIKVQLRTKNTVTSTKNVPNKDRKSIVDEVRDLVKVKGKSATQTEIDELLGDLECLKTALEHEVEACEKGD